MTNYTTDNIELGPELSAQVHEHVHSDTENEVGGVLVGTLRDGVADIRHVLPALEAVGGAAQLTFTHEVWEQLLSTVDRDHPDEQIVGWYHSHPGHGIFLSSFDRFIHENFFSAPGMVALVVDPRDDDAFGWFGWEDGALTRLGSDLPVDRPDRAEIPREISAAAAQRQSEERDMEAVYRGVMIAFAVLVVFFMGLWFKSGEVSDAERQRDAARAEANDSEEQAHRTRQALAVVCQAVTTEAAKDTDAAPEPSTDGVPASPSPTADAAEGEPERKVTVAESVCAAFTAASTTSDSATSEPTEATDGTEAETPASPEPSPSGTE